MTKRISRRHGAYAALATAAVVAGAETSLAAAASGSNVVDEDPFASMQPGTYDQSDYALGALLEEATEADALPTSIDAAGLGIGGIDLSSTRLIGGDANATYWAGLDSIGHLCLVTVLSDGDGLASAGCDTPESFATRGVGIQVGGPTAAAEGYIGADQSSANARRAAPSAESNLVIVDPYASSAERDALSDEISGVEIIGDPLDLEL